MGALYCIQVNPDITQQVVFCLESLLQASSHMPQAPGVEERLGLDSKS